MRFYSILLHILLLLCFEQIQSYGQAVDTIKGVEIIDKNKSNTSISNAGNFKITFDSIYRQAYSLLSIDKLLQEQSNVFVRSYGVNNMATISIRGTSAAQNAVLWEEVPINSPSMGVSDISTINNILFSNIAIESGSNSLQFGSGNIGGNIQLNNKVPNFQKLYKQTLHAGYGSFNNKQLGNQFLWSNEKIQIQLNGFFNNADNNFKYLKNDSLIQLNNADATAYGGLGSINIKLTTNDNYFKHFINVQYWVQKYQRSIPPALFETESSKYQQDIGHKALMQWMLKSNKLEWSIKSAYINDQMMYNDTNIHLFTKYIPQSIFAQAQVKYLFSDLSKLGIHGFNIIAPFQFNSIKNLISSNESFQNKQAIAILHFWRSNNNRFGINSGLRKEWTNQLQKTPLIPSISANANIFKADKQTQLQLLFSLQRAYRLPTLHELYFFPGGNEQLLPEHGWNIQFGSLLNMKVSVTDHQLSATVYNRNINNWIYWMGGAIWTAHNIAQVESQGLDLQYKLKINISEAVQIQTQLSYAYTAAITTASHIPNDKSIGKRIPYVPKNLFNQNISFIWKGAMANINYGYTGYRFTTTDESNYLASYHLVNTQFSYPLSVNNNNIVIGLNINNILNKEYTVIANRPMPGRNFLVTLRYTIQ